jgi:hypothetical protein
VVIAVSTLLARLDFSKQKLLALLTIVQTQLKRLEVCGFVDDAYRLLIRYETWCFREAPHIEGCRSQLP